MNEFKIIIAISLIGLIISIITLNILAMIVGLFCFLYSLIIYDMNSRIIDYEKFINKLKYFNKEKE